MIWLRLAWRNMWRNRRRTLIELAAIAGSVFIAVFMQNMATGSYDKIIDEGSIAGSGHVGLYHPEYLAERQAGMTFPAGELLPKLAEIDHVKGVYPRIYLPGLTRSSRESRPGMLIGLDIEKELAVNPLLQMKRYVDGAPPVDPGKSGSVPAVIGVVMAEELGLKVGKKFVFMAQDASGDIQRQLVRVAGILKTGSREIDGATIIVPRSRLALFTGDADNIHEIAMMLDERDAIPAVLASAKPLALKLSNAQAYPWNEAMPALASAITMDSSGLQITVFILFLLVGIGTINTLLMSVMERTREFGIMRALGINRKGIRKMVLAEATVLAGVGVGSGVALALLVNIYTSTYGLDFSGAMEGQEMAGMLIEPIMHSAWDISKTVYLSAGMFLLALIASLYPAHRILKIQPSDAMRR